MDTLEHRPQTFVGVTTPTLIYVGIADREAFDRIAAPCTDHGQKPTGHVLSKSVDNGSVLVVFQYWINNMTVDAILAGGRAKRVDAPPPELPSLADIQAVARRAL
jgi:hypothetical protein